MQDTTNAPATVAPTAGKTSHAITAVGGAGIGAVLITLLEGHPEVIGKIAAGWAPAMLMLGGVIGALFFLAYKFLPLIISAQVQQAASMQSLADSISRKVSEEDDVRMAVRTLAGKVDNIAEAIQVFAGSREKVSAAHGD